MRHNMRRNIDRRSRITLHILRFAVAAAAAAASRRLFNAVASLAHAAAQRHATPLHRRRHVAVVAAPDATLAGHIAHVRRQAGHRTRASLHVLLDVHLPTVGVRAHLRHPSQLLRVAASRQKHHHGVGHLQRAAHQADAARLHVQLQVECGVPIVPRSAPRWTHEDDVGAHVEIVREEVADAELDAIGDAVDARIVASQGDLVRIDVHGDDCKTKIKRNSDVSIRVD